MKKVSVKGGMPQIICDARSLSGCWGQDDVIVFSDQWKEILMRVPAAGGEPEPITTKEKHFEGEQIQRLPQILPGAKAVLFTADHSFNNQKIAVVSF